MNTIHVDGRRVAPSKIVCVGRNYMAHIEELNNAVPDEPVFFLKPNSAISDRLAAFHQEPLHYEGEMCFAVDGGRFAAVGFGLDLTKRALQDALKAKGLPWERCKAFDGAALFSPFVYIASIGDRLNLELRINDRVVQAAGISRMIHQPAAILDAISRFMHLEDGDVVMTGTPAGVGVVTAGDKFHGAIRDGDVPLTAGSWVAG